jgi:MFS family permease
MLLLPLFYQEARGATALSAGIMLVPQGVGALLSRGLAGRLTDKIGGRPVAVAGFAIIAAATIPFCYAHPKTSSWLLALWLLVRGIGLGAVMIAVTTVGYLGLDRAEIPHASVLIRTAQQIGGSFGTAVLAVILETAATSHPGNLTAAFNIAFWWPVGFAALAVVLSFWLPGRPRPSSDHAPAAGHVTGTTMVGVSPS